MKLALEQAIYDIIFNAEQINHEKKINNMISGLRLGQVLQCTTQEITFLVTPINPKKGCSFFITVLYNGSVIYWNGDVKYVIKQPEF